MKELFVLLVDPWKECFIKRDDFADSNNIKKVEISTRMKTLMNGDTQVGFEIKSALNKGQLINDKHIYDLWNYELKNLSHPKFYLYNFPFGDKNFNLFCDVCDENNLKLSKTYYFRKSDLSLSDEDKAGLRSAIKIDGKDAERHFWDTKRYWTRENEILLEKLDGDFELIEV